MIDLAIILTHVSHSRIKKKLALKQFQYSFKVNSSKKKETKPEIKCLLYTSFFQFNFLKLQQQQHRKK